MKNLVRMCVFVVVLASGCSTEDQGNTSSKDISQSDATSRDTAVTSMDTQSPPPIDVIGSGGEPCFAEGDDLTTVVFINRCLDPVHVRGSDIEDALLEVDGLACRHVGTTSEMLSAKRYWGFIGEDPGGGRHTLAEFTFNTDFQDFDWYNISHVDAHNLTMQIIPLERDDCDTLTCDDDALLSACPEPGRYTDGTGALTSCVSPDRDDPQSAVARHFEACDDGYAWSGDDQQGEDPSPVRACAGEDWAIVFCP